MQCTRQLEYVQRRAKELRQDCSEYFAEAHPSLQGIKDPIEATLAAAQLLLQSPDTTEEFQLRFAQRMLEMAEFLVGGCRTDYRYIWRSEARPSRWWPLNHVRTNEVEAIPHRFRSSIRERAAEETNHPR